MLKKIWHTTLGTIDPYETYMYPNRSPMRNAYPMAMGVPCARPNISAVIMTDGTFPKAGTSLFIEIPRKISSSVIPVTMATLNTEKISSDALDTFSIPA